MQKKVSRLTKPSLALLLLSGAFFSFTDTSYASEKSTEISQTKLSHWNESKDTQPHIYRSNTPIDLAGIQLYHNDGNPIETNILDKTDNPDMNLFAVAEYNIDNVDYKSYYFSDVDSESLNNIQTKIFNKAQDDTSNSTLKTIQDTPVQYAKGSGAATRNYNWSFSTGAKLTSTVEFNRASAYADINGKQGSVWDIKAISQIENTVTNPPYVSWTKRLAVPYSAQRLIDFGPDDTSATTMSVSLSGVVPGASWTFQPGGFSIDSTSSLSSKYGRWTLNKNTFNPTPKSAKMSPGIRTSNTSGNLGLELSHAYNRAGGHSHQTGIVSMYVTDR